MSSFPPDDRRPGLPPPRFRLRTLLWLLTIACVLLTLLMALDTYGRLFTILLVLAIAAHWMGAALGHRLRDNGDHPIPPRAKEQAYRAVEPQEFAPATKLSQRRGQNKWVLGFTIGWTVVGGLVGGLAIYWMIGQRANFTNITAGALAFAVLGAIWGFALSAFCHELFSAWREAQK